jgi:hypothetical protein
LKRFIVAPLTPRPCIAQATADDFAQRTIAARVAAGAPVLDSPMRNRITIEP